MATHNDLSAATAGAQFDFIIVGGGSAGCVLAARLSESPQHRVVLIEAGSDFAPGSEPELISDPRARAFFAQRFLWPGLLVEANPKMGEVGPVFAPLAQGRIMGGGSAINGMHAQRGEPSDYDEWQQHGVVGWSWQEVLPFFRKVEADVDFPDPQQTSPGPVKIRRAPPETWSRLSHALASEFTRRGVPTVDDVNAHPGDSIAAVPLNATDQRASSASAYLTAEVRARSNLLIVANTLVKRLLFKETRVVGVELVEPANKQILGAQVIVSCGAIHSPALLQRSGVGPADLLNNAGIPLVVARDSVGQGLQNHPMINAVTAHLRSRARTTGLEAAPCLMVVRYSSRVTGCPRADMLINLWERIPGPMRRDPLLRHFANFMLILNKSYSSGAVSIDAARPFATPKVRFNLLADARDRERMLRGVHLLATMTYASAFDGLITDRLALKPNPLMLMLMQPGWRARVVSEAGALAMALPAAVRRSLLEIAGTPIESLLSDPAALEKFVLTETKPAGHPTGSCRMGDAHGSAAVVDSRCRVIGVAGVRVVDASIFPAPLRAGTNLPTMMAAEKAAAMIIEDARQAS